jgi:hypothetical protein
MECELSSNGKKGRRRRISAEIPTILTEALRYFLSPSRKMYYNLKLGHGRFFPHSCQFISTIVIQLFDAI